MAPRVQAPLWLPLHDMTYLGALQGSVEGSANVAHLDHSQAAARVAVAIRPAYGASGGTGIALFDPQSLMQIRSQASVAQPNPQSAE